MLKKFFYEVILKKLIHEYVLETLDDVLKKIPANGQKTLIAFFIGATDVIIQNFPASCDYMVCAVNQYLLTLPHDEIVAGSVGFMALGLFHKLVKYLKEVIAKV